MKKHNILKAVFKSIVLILIGTMLFSCENDLAIISSIKVDETTPIETSYDVMMEYTDSGKVVMKMRSPLVNRYVGDEEYLEMPKGIDLVFFDINGKPKSTMVSDFAINYIKTKIMVAENNVVATNSQGQKLYTEQLTWDQEKHSIFTEKKVKVVTDGKILFGDGLVADESFENWEITHPTADIDLDEEGENTNDNNNEVDNNEEEDPNYEEEPVYEGEIF